MHRVNAYDSCAPLSGFAVKWVIIVAATALTWVAEPDAHNLARHVVLPASASCSVALHVYV